LDSYSSLVPIDNEPMTTFRNHSAEIMRHLKATKRPVILTVNGKAAAVVQDAEAYQHPLDLVRRQMLPKASGKSLRI
jgi:prevent-host-death family protein